MSLQHEKTKKILSVVGPTASGKTAFALEIAKQALKNQTGQYTGVDLISVDSRQVYAELEILSGADVPVGFKKVVANGPFAFPYYKHSILPITLHGISILPLNQEWSVVHFKDFATKIILTSLKQDRLPILVGGTGLYHQHLFTKDANLYIPPDQTIRESAAGLDVLQLQEWLSKVALKKFESLNNSDKNNPRRLIRAIEIALGTPRIESTTTLPKDIEVTTYGMEISLEEMQKKISQRVQERFENGAITEVENVLHVCSGQDLPVCSTLGVSDLAELLSGKIDSVKCQENWTLHEYQYAKRQLTWFKKNKNIIWLDDLQKKQYTFS